jgi:SdrD B-like protein
VPHLADDKRLRVQLTQGLSRRYVLQLEYGRPATYQSLWLESSRPRIKIMLQHVMNVSTPKRGGEVRGRVVDELARPVAAARVKLGPYTTDSLADGTYLFRDLPRGEYDLALDESHLPADYAWDGRQQRLAVLPSSRLQLDLVVTPLNAIHGRVFADRNANGRFDEGEAVSGVVLRVQDRATMTDRDGAYSFYNLWPGAYVIRLDAARLAAGLEAAWATELAVTLVDGRPVTGADFLVAGKAKAIIWKEIR